MKKSIFIVAFLMICLSSLCFGLEKATATEVEGQFIYSNCTVQDEKYVSLKLLNETLQTIPENEKLLKQANVSYGFMWAGLSVMLAGLTVGTVYACLPNETPYRTLVQDICWYTAAGSYLASLASCSFYNHYIHLAIDNYNFDLFKEHTNEQ